MIKSYEEWLNEGKFKIPKTFEELQFRVKNGEKINYYDVENDLLYHLGFDEKTKNIYCIEDHHLEPINQETFDEWNLANDKSVWSKNK